MPGTPMRLQRLRPCECCLWRGLDAKAAAMNPPGEFHIHSLFDRLEEVHHEVMRDVEAAEREHVFIFRPLASHSPLEALFLEEPFLDSGKMGASQVRPM